MNTAVEVTPSAEGVEVLDPRGDLTIIVGPEKVAFRVCSRAVARSSQYWEVMLYGPFSEGQAQQENGSWEVELPEDDPGTLKILLAAVHAQHQDIPVEVTRDELLCLAAAADKFDMIGLLKPFWSVWVEKVTLESEPSVVEALEALNMCYTLGHSKWFEYYLHKLATHTELNGERDLSIEFPGGVSRMVDDEDFDPESKILGALCHKFAVKKTFTDLRRMHRCLARRP